MVEALKKLFRQVGAHIRTDFDLRIYLSTALFLAMLLSLNFRFNFKDGILDQSFGHPVSYLWYPLFYLIPYYFISVPLLWVRGKGAVVRTSTFWLKSAALLVTIGFADAFDLHFRLAEWVASDWGGYYLIRTGVWAKRILIYVPMLYLIARLFGDETSGVYGLKWKGSDLRPYGALLLLMMPLLLAASFSPGFQSTYPIFKVWRFQPAWGLNAWHWFGINELVYGGSFVMIEWMFRGALVLGMGRLMGRDSILPMVVVYAIIHFDKPVAEAISSIFGGYLLGVIAWKSRHILGGVLLHIGIAWAMELFALIQYYWNQ